MLSLGGRRKRKKLDSDSFAREKTIKEEAMSVPSKAYEFL
jgi:hypothetical protein